MKVARKKITISHHAKLRLAQRVPNRLGYPTDEQLVTAARYKGEKITLGRRFQRVVKTCFKGFIFVFQLTKTSWELVTVYSSQKNI